MRKRVFGRQFKRDKNERKALFKGLISSLILYERIKTTEEKAKAIKGEIEKIVTKVKKNGNRKAALVSLQVTPLAFNKLTHDIAHRFIKRPGGYTRIIRLGRRLSDNASMALLEWVEGPASVDERKLKIEAGETKKENKSQEQKVQKSKSI